MLGSAGLAKGVGSPVMWHLYHSVGPSLILRQDDIVYQPLPEYAQTLIPLLILTLSHSLSHRSLQTDGLNQQHLPVNPEALSKLRFINICWLEPQP